MFPPKPLIGPSSAASTRHPQWLAEAAKDTAIHPTRKMRPHEETKRPGTDEYGATFPRNDCVGWIVSSSLDMIDGMIPRVLLGGWICLDTEPQFLAHLTPSRKKIDVSGQFRRKLEPRVSTKQGYQKNCFPKTLTLQHAIHNPPCQRR